MQLATVTLRPSTREEARRVIGFYEANRREFLLPRPVSDFTNAVERGQHFVIEIGGEIDEAFDSCLTCAHSVAPRKCCCDFYLLPVASARAAVSKLLLESAAGEIVLSNKNNDELRIECAGCRFLAEEEIRSMLEEFVAGSTWG